MGQGRPNSLYLSGESSKTGIGNWAVFSSRATVVSCMGSPLQWGCLHSAYQRGLPIQAQGTEEARKVLDLISQQFAKEVMLTWWDRGGHTVINFY